MSLYDPAELKAIEDNYNARLRTAEAYELCSRLALSDDQLAEYWGIDLHTLLDWKLAYAGFLDAIEAGRTLDLDVYEDSDDKADERCVEFIKNHVAEDENSLAES